MRKAFSRRGLIVLVLVIGLLANMMAVFPVQAAAENSVDISQVAYSAGEVKLGDVSGDGLVNSIDYILLQRYLLEIIADFTNPNGKAAADVDRDGAINSTDLTLLKRYLLKIIRVFPDNSAVYKNPNAPIEDRVNDLMARMTLEEKVGQMIQGERMATTSTDVKDYYLGSVLSGGGSAPYDNTPEGWMAMVKSYQDAAMSTRLGIPIIYGTDAVHGHNNAYGAVIFPHNIALGAAANPELMAEVGKVTAEELLATGITWNFAPVVAVARDERWGRTYESYSENPDLVNLLSVPFIRAMQDNYGLAATAKHFLADGGTLGGKDQGDAVMTEEELRRIHLPVYKEAINNGVKSVMISFSSWNGVKNTENKYLITDMLKGELGFNGFVVSDWEAIKQTSGATFYDQVVNCVNAGIDMLMEPYKWMDAVEILKTAAQNGDIPQARIDDAVRRILKVKFETGLFEKPLGDQSLITNGFGSQENREIAKRAVRESLVLLKNENNILPLKKNAKILVTGPSADNVGLQCSGWTMSWRGGMDSFGRKFVPGTTIMEGFKKIAESNGGTILTDPYAASEADLVVLVIGEMPYVELYGDARDLTVSSEELMIGGTNIAIREAKETGKPIVTVLLSGRPRIVTDLIGDWSALVAAWFPGSEGEAVAEVLYGDYDFKGKLPMTWPSSNEQIPINVDDMGTKIPAFPYGYGLKMYN
ncbi:MAG: glycoside hydrolase family 3 N-terminal domain-containing protein [Bacillota bacterium]